MALVPRIDAFLRLARERDCSDIHLTVGLPPLVRLDGELTQLRYRELTRVELDDLLHEILTERHVQRLEERGSVDLSYRGEETGRFRINVCRQILGMSAACRVIPERMPFLDDLGLPSVISRLTTAKAGLILVTGSAGTGKSTTLAAMIHAINASRSLNILTLEDPIEFVHENLSSQVIQREVGMHVNSFAEGLRAGLRQDPDVILVGEMRDPETIALAIEASETGQLVFGTLHTRGAYQTVHRIVDAFPTEGQPQVRQTLADNLKCVVSHDLVRAADGRGRRAVAEIMVNTPAISQMIRESKTFQIPQAIATGRRFGMQLMDQALLLQVQAGEIDPNDAYLRSTDRREFLRFVTETELLQLVEQSVLRKAG